MEAMSSPETSVLTRTTRSLHIPEDRILEIYLLAGVLDNSKSPLIFYIK
jgi:hypothetical protein